MPTYTIKKLIDTYDNKIKALEKDDEFGLNKSVDTYKKSREIVNCCGLKFESA